jgi:hypothetical protein
MIYHATIDDGIDASAVRGYQAAVNPRTAGGSGVARTVRTLWIKARSVADANAALAVAGINCEAFIPVPQSPLAELTRRAVQLWRDGDYDGHARVAHRCHKHGVSTQVTHGR